MPLFGCKKMRKIHRRIYSVVWYEILAPPETAWVSGNTRPMPYNQIDYARQGSSSHRQFKTKRRAFGVGDSIPGCTIIKWYYRHGVRYMRSWEVDQRI